jgi:hypothetical protein
MKKGGEDMEERKCQDCGAFRNRPGWCAVLKQFRARKSDVCERFTERPQKTKTTRTR